MPSDHRSPSQRSYRSISSRKERRRTLKHGNEEESESDTSSSDDSDNNSSSDNDSDDNSSSNESDSGSEDNWEDDYNTSDNDSYYSRYGQKKKDEEMGSDDDDDDDDTSAPEGSDGSTTRSTSTRSKSTRGKSTRSVKSHKSSRSTKSRNSKLKKIDSDIESDSESESDSDSDEESDASGSIEENMSDEESDSDFSAYDMRSESKKVRNKIKAIALTAVCFLLVTMAIVLGSVMGTRKKKANLEPNAAANPASVTAETAAPAIVDSEATANTSTVYVEPTLTPTDQPSSRATKIITEEGGVEFDDAFFQETNSEGDENGIPGEATEVSNGDTYILSLPDGTPMDPLNNRDPGSVGMLLVQGRNSLGENDKFARNSAIDATSYALVNFNLEEQSWFEKDTVLDGYDVNAYVCLEKSKNSVMNDQWGNPQYTMTEGIKEAIPKIFSICRIDNSVQVQGGEFVVEDGKVATGGDVESITSKVANYKMPEDCIGGVTEKFYVAADDELICIDVSKFVVNYPPFVMEAKKNSSVQSNDLLGRADDSSKPNASGDALKEAPKEHAKEAPKEEAPKEAPVEAPGDAPVSEGGDSPKSEAPDKNAGIGSGSEVVPEIPSDPTMTKGGDSFNPEPLTPDEGGDSTITDLQTPDDEANQEEEISPEFRENEEEEISPEFRENEEEGISPEFRENEEEGISPEFNNRDERKLEEEVEFRDRNEEEFIPDRGEEEFGNRDEEDFVPEFRENEEEEFIPDRGEEEFGNREKEDFVPEFRENEEEEVLPEVIPDRDEKEEVVPEFRENEEEEVLPEVIPDRDEKEEVVPEFRENEDEEVLPEVIPDRDEKEEVVPEFRENEEEELEGGDSIEPALEAPDNEADNKEVGNPEPSESGEEESEEEGQASITQEPEVSTTPEPFTESPTASATAVAGKISQATEVITDPSNFKNMLFMIANIEDGQDATMQFFSSNSAAGPSLILELTQKMPTVSPMPSVSPNPTSVTETKSPTPSSTLVTPSPTFVPQHDPCGVCGTFESFQPLDELKVLEIPIGISPLPFTSIAAPDAKNTSALCTEWESVCNDGHCSEQLCASLSSATDFCGCPTPPEKPCGVCGEDEELEFPQAMVDLTAKQSPNGKATKMTCAYLEGYCVGGFCNAGVCSAVQNNSVCSCKSTVPSASPSIAAPSESPTVSSAPTFKAQFERCSICGGDPLGYELDSTVIVQLNNDITPAPVSSGEATCTELEALCEAGYCDELMCRSYQQSVAASCGCKGDNIFARNKD